MDNYGIKYLLTYLRDLETRIDNKRSELKTFANYTGVSVSNMASIASELNALLTEQRTICFTLRSLGYYVVYPDGVHAEKIVLDSTGEVVAE